MKDEKRATIDGAVSYTLSDKLSNKILFTELAAIYISNSRLKHQSIKKYNSLKHDFERYEMENNTRVYINDINSSFLEKIGKWMSTSQDNFNPTINRKFKTINAMMNYAVDENMISSKGYKRMKPLDEIKENDKSLTEDELNILKSQPRNQWLDIFLFSCETGLRVSDLKELSVNNIKMLDRYKVLDFYTEKVKKAQIVPLSNYACTIIEGRDGKVFTKISGQKLNQYLKSIFKLAGLDRKIEQKQIKWVTQVTTVNHLWEIAHIHMGRHTYATRLAEGGLPLTFLQDNLGHSAITTSMKYTHVADINRTNATLEILNRSK
ncbi:MAG TPA: tyrosine-type recombinase/integrase [Clostridia bacterium]|nr:tyrosine-type recombinase/integrase [Clostridia bacterium]